MSGNYVLRCGCGASETMEPQQLCRDTIENAMRLMPAFESIGAAGWDTGDQRGDAYESAGMVLRFMLDHWRHGSMSYSYDNNDEPPVPLKPPPEARLPVPCFECGGRRLIPCPEC